MSKREKYERLARDMRIQREKEEFEAANRAFFSRAEASQRVGASRRQRYVVPETGGGVFPTSEDQGRRTGTYPEPRGKEEEEEPPPLESELDPFEGPSGLPPETTANILQDVAERAITNNPTASDAQIRDMVAEGYFGETGREPEPALLDSILSAVRLGQEFGLVTPSVRQMAENGVGILRSVAGYAQMSQNPSVISVRQFLSRIGGWLSPIVQMQERAAGVYQRQSPGTKALVATGARGLVAVSPMIWSTLANVINFVYDYSRGDGPKDPVIEEMKEEVDSIMAVAQTGEAGYKELGAGETPFMTRTEKITIKATRARGIKMSPAEVVGRAELAYDTSVATSGPDSTQSIRLRSQLIHANRIYLYSQLQDSIHRRATPNEFSFDSVKMRALGPCYPPEVAHPYQKTVLGVHGPLEW